MKKTTFALFFGNRGFFPEKLIAAARTELESRLAGLGYGTLSMPAVETRFGAVEGAAEGEKYAAWLASKAGQFDGVILCLPNFGDENGAVAALKNAGVPILVQAYPDEHDKMGFSERRDAFCGKFSIMDVFYQYGVKYTSFPPHTAHPGSDVFAAHVRDFARVCRVVKGLKSLTLGVIGARTTAFKTVRFDELALQRHGITCQTFDLSSVIATVNKLKDNDEKVVAKVNRLTSYANCSAVPQASMTTMAKLGVAIDDLVADEKLDAIALRCWIELEIQLRVAPCLLVSEINDRLIPCACEVDVCNAVMMRALQLASEEPATCLDWNNNYGDEANKCILFHCGPVPQSLMAAKGTVVDHPMFAKSFGDGCGWGPNVGRIAPMDMTFASCITENGKLTFYADEGAITKDVIAEDYFGCAGVAEIPNLQHKLHVLGRSGYRHHTSMTRGHVAEAVRHALTTYLGYDLQSW
jgi:L-fucose isomerase-like protein